LLGNIQIAAGALLAVSFVSVGVVHSARIEGQDISLIRESSAHCQPPRQTDLARLRPDDTIRIHDRGIGLGIEPLINLGNCRPVSVGR
jgi:hypothetical protein